MRFQQFSLGLLAITLPLSIAAANFAWCLALFIFVLRWAIDPDARRYRWTGLELPWLLFFGATVLSCLFAAEPLRGFRKLPSELLVVVFFVASQLQSRDDTERNVPIFLLAAGFVGLWGAIQSDMGIVRESGQLLNVPEWAAGLPAGVLKELTSVHGRAVGYFSHPLTYANMLIMTAPIFLGIALLKDRADRRFWTLHGVPSWAAWLGFFLVINGIAASGSRMGVLAVFGAILIWALAKRHKKIVAVLGGLLILNGLFLLTIPTMRARVQEALRPSVDTSLNVRGRLWRAALGEFAEKPILGAGLGNFHVEVEPTIGTGPVRWSEAHNIFLQMAAERGLLGFAAFLFLLWRMGKIFLATGVESRQTGFFFGFIGLLLAGLTESWTHDSEVMLVLYFLLGCSSVLIRKESPE